MNPKPSILEYSSLKTFWILGAGLIILRFIFARFNTFDITAVISWDVLAHYLWLPGFFIHDDLGLLNFGWIEQILRHYQPLIGYHSAILQTEVGSNIFSTSMGMAVMNAPFFIIGHLIALFFGFAADGFSAPYQVAMVVGGCCWSVSGIWIIRKILLSFFSENTTTFTMVVMVAGTGYLNLAVFNGAAPENFLFTLYSLLLFLSIRLLSNPSYGLAAGIGLVAGLIFLTRIFDGLLTLPFIFYLAFRLSRKHIQLTAFMGFFFLFIASFQLIYWKIFTNQFVFNPGRLFPESLTAVLPYLFLLTLPAGYLIQYFIRKKQIKHITVFLLVVCCVGGFTLYKSVIDQIKLNHFKQARAKFIYRYDRAEVIPISHRYCSRTFLNEENEVLDHPEWFNTRRIFSLNPGLVRMNDQRRFSPGINDPLAAFSTSPWIGLQAKARIFLKDPGMANSGHLVITLLRDQKVFLWKGSPFQGKNLKTGQWNELTLNVIIHKPQPDDTLQSYVWYTGNSRILVGALSVTLFELSQN